MKKLLIVLFVVFSFTVCAADKATFAVKDEKIYSPTFAGSFLIYIMAPDRLAGWNGELKPFETDYMPEKYQNLPVLGGWQGFPIDGKLIKENNIKKALVIGDPNRLGTRVDELKSLGMDVLILQASSIEDYVPLLRELGRQMGITDRGNKLADFGKEMLVKTRVMAKNIPDARKVSVYAGSGPDALSAICNMKALALAGGKNAYECAPGSRSGSEEQISFEQLTAIDPGIIIVTNPSAAKVTDDPKWHNLRAYKEKRFYIPPYGPLGWLHHNTPVTGLMGTPWLVCTLYPDKCTMNIEEETKRYYKLFMNMNLSDKQLNQILYRYGK